MCIREREGYAYRGTGTSFLTLACSSIDAGVQSRATRVTVGVKADLLVGKDSGGRGRVRTSTSASIKITRRVWGRCGDGLDEEIEYMDDTADEIEVHDSSPCRTLLCPLGSGIPKLKVWTWSGSDGA